MWPELREEIELELAMLREHVDSISPLLGRCALGPPDLVETMALGAFLHGFYNGIENAFKRISIHVDGGPPTGQAWHQELLESMTRPNVNRPPVISANLAALLQGYLDFRHVFRHLYSYRLDWERMAELVRTCRDVLGQLEGELNLFLKVPKDERNK